jgi:hypothetical protein
MATLDTLTISDDPTASTLKIAVVGCVSRHLERRSDNELTDKSRVTGSWTQSMRHSKANVKQKDGLSQTLTFSSSVVTFRCNPKTPSPVLKLT